MHERKFSIVLVLGLCLQMNAMEQQTQVVVLEDNSNQLVSQVLLQVRPGYIAGTSIVKPVSGMQVKRHEQALSKLATDCKTISLSPIANLGAYFLNFAAPVALSKIIELCKEMPGFEKVHAINNDELEAVFDCKQGICEERLKQCDQHRARTQRNIAKLVLFKTLSASQMISKTEILAK